jgi:hypothetical protein
MTEETRKQLDTVIDTLQLERTTGKSRDELYKLVETAATEMDLAVCLADVINSLMLDIIDFSNKVKIPLIDEHERSYYKELRKLAEATRKWAMMATRDTRHSERDRDMAMESDWWYNLILMVEDRTGTDALKTKQLLHWISSMPSQMHLFDHIHTKDFERIIND